MPDLSSGYVAAYERDGYAIVRNVFSPEEIAAIGAAIDQVHEEGVAHGRSIVVFGLFDLRLVTEGFLPFALQL